MCGIAGVLLTSGFENSSGEAVTKADQILQKMQNRIRHRGPDDEGTLTLAIDQSVALGLGHTRLAILDTSSAGHQPMLDPITGNFITFNGEIYNYRRLRGLLDDAGEALVSNSDTEVILKTYARWGRDSLEYLRGMFAFGIWDARRKELFLARDRLGIKPLYYYVGDGFFLFASEVRALLATELVPRILDPVTLWGYLAYQSAPAPRALVKNVRVLLPGQWLTVKANGELNQGIYWSLLERTPGNALSSQELKRKVGDLLRESVALHLVSDVPVAAFLSGGIDSSALVALMRDVGSTPRTFTVCFNESEYTEASYARRIADRFGAEHTEIHLDERNLIDQLPEALSAMDQPTGDGVNTYVVSGAVRAAGIKVALSGLGGDEFFAGYPSFARLDRAARFLRLWSKAPSRLRTITARAFETVAGQSVIGAKMASIIGSDGTVATIYPSLRQVLSPAQRRALLADPLLSEVGFTQDPYVTVLTDAFAANSHMGRLSQVSYAEARTYMHDVLLRDTDQMSMAHALEVRVPLLDHRLVGCVMGASDEQKRSNQTPKRLLVESLNGLLPPEIVHRPKQGFTIPFDLWMRGALRSFCEESLSADRIESRGILRADQAQHLWHSFLERRPGVTWTRIWLLVVLEDWLQRNDIRGYSSE